MAIVQHDETITVEANRLRNEKLKRYYSPETGEGSDTGDRRPIRLADAPLPLQYIPAAMFDEPLVQQLARAGSLAGHLRQQGVEVPDGYSTPAVDGEKEEGDLSPLDTLWREWIRLRIRYDFEFWAFCFVRIKDKLGANDIPFRLNRPQRRILGMLEAMRTHDRPIRLILLKARQWGGSTLIQIYMAWIQLVHRRNWNSVICAHIKESAANIKGMYSKLLANYPDWLLEGGRPKFRPFERMANTSVIVGRDCRVTIGSAESQESVRGIDAAMAHLSEVAFWRNSRMKSPEQLVRSVCGSIMLLPYSMVVMESTANGTGSYFHQECERAKRHESDKQFAFVPWFEIEMYAIPVDDYESLIATLTDYERMLWSRGATLEAIAWYRQKRKEYARHTDMMAEYPSDDIEAFCYSGERVFDPTLVEKLRRGCCAPRFVGDIHGRELTGHDALEGIELEARPGGPLQVWEYPAEKHEIRDRYLAVVDIGGRSDAADYSVIAIFDRYWMLEGGPAEVVAQWRGHIDHDLLAWKAAQLAAYYQNALLVIESNTLETEHDDSEHSAYLLDTLSRYYDNLYARQAPPDSIGQRPSSRWGFHMNRATKVLVIDAQRSALREGAYIEHDAQACYEHDVFERKPNGSYGAMEGHHDDILITRCIGNYICSRDLPSFIHPATHRGGSIVNESSI